MVISQCYPTRLCYRCRNHNNLTLDSLILKCKRRPQNIMNILKCKCRNKLLYCILMLVKLFLGLPKLVFICQLCYFSVLREEIQSFCQGSHNAWYDALLQPLSGTDSMTDSMSTQLKPLPHNNSNNHRHRYVYSNYE